MEKIKSYKYLDLSGYAFTGKHAVIDLIREFRGYHVPHFECEFNLLRVQGGIRDLETALVDDWSPVRADAAIRRFKKLVRRIGGRNSISDVRSWFRAVGWNYDAIYGGKFIALSEEYINRLVEAQWKTDWPYPMTDLSDVELFLRKILRKLVRIKTAYDFTVYLPRGENFYEHTKRYLNALLSANVSDDTTTIVMHNAFEPFNPSRALRYFDSAKSIIVDRDPRDNYVAGLWYKPTALPPAEFVKRYRLYRDVAKRNIDSSGKILRIQYEELVLDYENTLSRILAFLGEDASVHVDKRRYFDPAISIKNVGIWRNHPKQDEIAYIREALPEYCRIS